MQKFDVIIIGGGPAGGQTARTLSKLGKNVLLVEKHKSFAENNFSSAGMTLAPLKEFDLPETVVGAYWKDLVIQCSKKCYTWYGKNKKGVVLNFQKLREFLAKETDKFGGTVLMGHKYVSREKKGTTIFATFVTSDTDKEVTFEATILVDATGPLRKVMYNNPKNLPDMILGSGTEYEIEVPQEIYDKFKDKLLFFLGHKWAIKGYSWIFPMENRILKVGAGKTHLKSLNQENTDKTTRKITEKIIDEYIGATEYKIIDKHGGIIKYSRGLKDIFYRDKIVGVGDAISAINPRGGEGIRYAMQSGELAARYIYQFLETGIEDFENYRKEWLKAKSKKWKLSEFSAGRMYNRYSDTQIENRIHFFHQNFSIDDMIDSLFNFKYNKVFVRAFKYSLLKLRYLFKNERF